MPFGLGSLGYTQLLVAAVQVALEHRDEAPALVGAAPALILLDVRQVGADTTRASAVNVQTLVTVLRPQLEVAGAEGHEPPMLVGCVPAAVLLDVRQVGMGSCLEL